MYWGPPNQLLSAKVGHTVICRPSVVGRLLQQKLLRPTTKHGCSHCLLVTARVQVSAQASAAEAASHALPDGPTLEVIQQLADKVGTLHRL